MGSIRSLRRPPLKRLHEAADVRLYFDLIELERIHPIGHIANPDRDRIN
jgi:hypothetical protein